MELAFERLTMGRWEFLSLQKFLMEVRRAFFALRP